MFALISGLVVAVGAVIIYCYETGKEEAVVEGAAVPEAKKEAPKAAPTPVNPLIPDWVMKKVERMVSLEELVNPTKAEMRELRNLQTWFKNGR